MNWQGNMVETKIEMQIIYDGRKVHVWEFVFQGLNIGKWNTETLWWGCCCKKKRKTVMCQKGGTLPLKLHPPPVAVIIPVNPYFYSILAEHVTLTSFVLAELFVTFLWATPSKSLKKTPVPVPQLRVGTHHIWRTSKSCYFRLSSVQFCIVNLLSTVSEMEYLNNVRYQHIIFDLGDHQVMTSGHNIFLSEVLIALLLNFISMGATLWGDSPAKWPRHRHPPPSRAPINLSWFSLFQGF